MNQNLLFDMLGILIGFTGIMFTLSLLVTALTQAVTGTFNLRAKNLNIGLEAFLKNTLDKETEKTIRKKLVKFNDLAESPPLRIPWLSKIGGGKKKKSSKKDICSTTWIDWREMEALLEDIGDAKKMKEIKMWFQRMEKEMSKRFQSWARHIALICAFLVAFAFQVSTPQLLKKLSTDSQYRTRAALAAEQLVNEQKQNYEQSVQYRHVTATALDQLQDKYPDCLQLEEVSGIDKTRDDLLSEIKLVLEDHPNRETIVEDYKSLLDLLYLEGFERAIQNTRKFTDSLARFDIGFWSQGWGYYRGNLENFFGVLVTAIFIALGAPFWFNTLQNLVSLRDALAPQKPKKKKRGKENEDLRTDLAHPGHDA